MLNVDFYLLNTPSKETSYRFLCRLVDKAYQQQHHSYIYTSSVEETQYLDDLLWTFRDISFIPHQTNEMSHAEPVLVTLGMEKPSKPFTDILFNLTPEIPDFFCEFQRIIEVVSEEKNHKTQSRKKYKFYKEQNYQLTTHNISLAC